MRVTTTMLSLLLLIIWTINVWATDDKKKVKEKRVWVQTTEKKAGLGVVLSNIDEDESGSAKEGARIVEVFKGSEAERIGLEKGDLIVELNGKSIKKPSDLVEIFEDVEEGAEVKLSILRDGEKKSFTAKLKPFEGHPYAFKVDDEDGDILIDIFRTPEHDKHFKVIHSTGTNVTSGGKGGYLGVKVKNLSSQLWEYFEVKNGVLVEEVMKDSPAEKSGLKAGDVIVSINDRKLEDYHDLIRTVNFYNPEEEVTVSYVRKGDTEETKAVLGKKSAYQWKTKKMKGPQSFQFISEDGENKVLISEDPDKKVIWVDENDANFNVEIKKEFFIL